MRMQFLSSQILVYGAIVDVDIAMKNSQLDAVGILTCQ